MDLYAYAQIDDLYEVMKKNNIEVPRLRGLRLMSTENAYTKKDIEQFIADMESVVYEDFCCSVPKFDPFSRTHCFSIGTRKIENKYLIKETITDIDFNGNPYAHDRVIGIRWDLIHGKARKRLKYALKVRRRRVHQTLETFNKYVGRSDVLYIHSRIGGGNWNFYGGPELSRQSWFIERVDDCFDDTYCDIYAKIGDI